MGAWECFVGNKEFHSSVCVIVVLSLSLLLSAYVFFSGCVMMRLWCAAASPYVPTPSPGTRRRL